MTLKNNHVPFKPLFCCMVIAANLLVNPVVLSTAQAKGFISNNISSAVLEKKVAKAIEKFEQTKKNHWSFEVSRYENEEGDVTSSIERYMPSETAPTPWQLLRLNGEQPTKKQIEAFIETKVAQQKEKTTGNSYSVALREIIQLDTLTFAKENEAHIEMNFDVFLNKLGNDASSKLQGSLLYNKQQQFIETLTITNKEEFSPIFSATIDDFKLTFTFTQINKQVLPYRQDMAMKGTFAFFTEIDEVSHDTFSNYQYLPSAN